MVKILKTDTTMWWLECKKLRGLSYPAGVGELSNNTASVDNGLAFPKNWTYACRVTQQIPLAGGLATAMKSHSHTKSCTRGFTTALFITAKNVEEKLWYVHIMERYSAVKRNELLTHERLGSGITVSKRNQSQKVPYVWFHLYDILEYKINSDRDRWVAVRP